MKKLYVLLIPILVVLGYILYNARTAPTTATSQEVVQSTILEQYTPPTPSELLALTNIERQKAGVAPLQLDERLNQSAQWKADDMVARNYFSHEDPITGKYAGLDLAQSLVQNCSYASENQAADYESNPIKGFKTSESHWEAVLDTRYELVGYGVNSEYVVVHFCDI